ncbi:MAG: beta-galactosidase [Anaerolineaceae bacterium]|nr:beta-galactosidase [Anaerolineaceae bacterium]
MTYRFGADYYPEYWGEERWAIDARMMADAGFNVVRICEFAWTRLEPQAGVFTFDWLDRVIAVLAQHGIDVVLGTPTASPPPWLMNSDSTMFAVLADGRRLTYGGRCEYCPNHEGYHAATERIVRAMAARYGHHPNVIGWQIDNEFGDPCYCPVCQRAFQDWLKVKYGTLERLNQCWGTDFWSHVYQAWDEIPVPFNTIHLHNPGLSLDFKRFASDSYIRYQQLQIDILREHCRPGQRITHNLMGFSYEQLDYYRFTEALDFVAWDNYVRGFWDMRREVDPSVSALGHDTMRGMKQQPFWVMEQQAGPTGGSMIGVTPRPGELRLWAYQAAARGADGIVFFRWRTCRNGAEEYWHGVLDHHGEPTRRYAELAQMGQELKRFGGALLDSMPVSKVAVLQSYDTRFAFQTQPINEQFSYKQHVQDVYRAFHQRNVGVDVIRETASLEGYQLVVLPAFYLLREDTAGRLAAFAEQGGVVLITGRSGVKDEYNGVVNQRLPGYLRKLCGARVEEYDSMAPDMRNQLRFAHPDLADAPPVEIRLWEELIVPEGAEVVAHYAEDYLAGEAAITINSVGKGKVIYAGVLGDTALYAAMMDWLLGLAGLQTQDAPEGVEITERSQDGKTFRFILNHNDEPCEILIEEPQWDLIREFLICGVIELAPKGVLILTNDEIR